MEIGLMFFFNSVIWLSIGYASLCVIRAVFTADAATLKAMFKNGK